MEGFIPLELSIIRKEFLYMLKRDMMFSTASRWHKIRVGYGIDEYAF